MLMDSLVRYYLQQAGRGKHDGMGPIYAAAPFFRRVYGIGSFSDRVMATLNTRPLEWCQDLGARYVTYRRRYLDRYHQIDGQRPSGYSLCRLNESDQYLISKLRRRVPKR